MKYVVTLNGRPRTVVVHGDEVEVDGRRVVAELRPVPGTPLRHLVLPDSATTLVMEPGSSGHWLVQHRGERFEVEALDARTRHIRSLIGKEKSNAGGGVLKAPMPGLVVRLLVEVGQAVTAGQGIVVLEAMKMENELKAAGAGVVERIEVTVGVAVEKGAVLVVVGQGGGGTGGQGSGPGG